MPTERAIAAQRVQWYRQQAAEHGMAVVHSELHLLDEDDDEQLNVFDTVEIAREAAHYALLAQVIEDGETVMDQE